jgi:DNA-directed RNA polymerase specialized sigma24 family protein
MEQDTTEKKLPITTFHDYMTFVQQYYALVMRYAYRVIPFKSEAEQLVAYIIFDLWEQRKKLDSPDAIRSHLKKHTRLQCSNWLYYKTINRNKQPQLKQ